MDLRTVVTISTLLVMTAESDSASTGTPSTPSTPSSPSSLTNSTSKISSLPSADPEAPAGSPSSPSSSAPALGLLTIRWTRCEGEVNLVLFHPSNSSSPVCHSSETSIRSILKNVCENKDGCENRPPSWVEGQDAMTGYDITVQGAREVMRRCKTLKVQCTVQVHPDVDLQGQLQAYRVMTALLCCVLLVLILIRFTRPSIRALQKRLSERRQNRWIGPTQSHSVSYHRGKSAVKNTDGEMRLSYPALERLAVSDSREPSSNRNSDYNF